MAEWHEGYNKATEHTHDTLDDLGVPRQGEDGATLYIHQRIRAYGDKRAREAVEALLAAGWRIVPAEPTGAMVDAGGFEETKTIDSYEGDVTVCVGDDAARRVYAAMLAAYPYPFPSPDMLEKR